MEFFNDQNISAGVPLTAWGAHISSMELLQSTITRSVPSHPFPFEEFEGLLREGHASARRIGRSAETSLTRILLMEHAGKILFNG